MMMMMMMMTTMTMITTAVEANTLNICRALFWVFCNSQLCVNCIIYLILTTPKVGTLLFPFYRLSN